MPTAQKVFSLVLILLLVVLAGAGVYRWSNNKNLPDLPFLCRTKSLDFSPDLMVASGKLQAVDGQNLILLDKNGQVVSFKLALRVTVVEITADQQWIEKDISFLEQKFGQEVSVDLFPTQDKSYQIKNIRLGE